MITYAQEAPASACETVTCVLTASPPAVTIKPGISKEQLRGTTTGAVLQA